MEDRQYEHTNDNNCGRILRSTDAAAQPDTGSLIRVPPVPNQPFSQEKRSEKSCLAVAHLLHCVFRSRAGGQDVVHKKKRGASDLWGASQFEGAVDIDRAFTLAQGSLARNGAVLDQKGSFNRRR